MYILNITCNRILLSEQKKKPKRDIYVNSIADIKRMLFLLHCLGRYAVQ